MLSDSILDQAESSNKRDNDIIPQLPLYFEFRSYAGQACKVLVYSRSQGILSPLQWKIDKFCYFCALIGIYGCLFFHYLIKENYPIRNVDNCRNSRKTKRW